MRYLYFFISLISFATAQETSIPSGLTDRPDPKRESGVNEFTSPSIKKIFSDLELLAPLPKEALNREILPSPPIERTALALELGQLIADGFLAVQAGQTKEIEPLARTLSRYARALGAGDRVNQHASSLLLFAKNNEIEKLKNELKATQEDVEMELIQLRDPGLASLIGLGGWLRAFDVASLSLENQFSSERAQLLLRPEVPAYFIRMLETLKPEEQRVPANVQLANELEKLQQTLESSKKSSPKPTLAKQLRIHAIALKSAADAK